MICRRSAFKQPQQRCKHCLADDSPVHTCGIGTSLCLIKKILPAWQTGSTAARHLNDAPCHDASSPYSQEHRLREGQISGSLLVVRDPLPHHVR